MAWEQLFDDNMKMVRIFASNMSPMGVYPLGYEDILQEGYMELMKVAKRYDPSNAKGASFTTYAHKRVRGRMLDFIRSMSGSRRVHNPKTIRLVTENDVDGYSEALSVITEPFTERTPVDELSHEEECRVIVEVMRRFDPRIPKIIKDVVNGVSLTDIGKSLNISKGSVSFLLMRMREAMCARFISNAESAVLRLLPLTLQDNVNRKGA